MASHAPQTVLFVTNNGSVMTDGYSARLGRGQFGIIDKGAAPTALGQRVTSTIATTPKDRLFELAVGAPNLTPSKFQTNKTWKSRPFKLSEVVDISVSAPKIGISVDKWILGYDGFNDSSAIVLQNGDNEVIDITLEGEAIGMLGYADSKVTVKLYLEAPNTGAFTMHQIVEEAVERLKAVTLKGGVPITTYIKIAPVNSENPVTVTGTNYAFYSLTVADSGRESDLGLVQAQYPLHKVERTDYSDGKSTYTIVAPDPTVLANFVVTTTTLADANCDGEPEVTNTTATIAWVKGATCTAIEETYTLQLADDCEGSRLTDLQAFYPGLVITEVLDSDNACQRKYETKVLTDIVCEDCSPLLRDLFSSVAPVSFEFIDWVKAPKVYSATAKMGIVFEGKENIFAGSEEYRDEIPFLFSSTRISVANEAPGMVNSSFNAGTNGRFALKLISRAQDPSGLGKDLFDLEERTRMYFTDAPRHHGNNYAKLALGEESLLKPLKYYVVYSVRVRPVRFAQSFSGDLAENFNYLIVAEVGKHSAVETYVNALATAAGLPTVSAY